MLDPMQQYTGIGAVLLFPIRMVMNIVIIMIVLPCVWIAAWGWKPGSHLQPWQKFIMRVIIPPIIRTWVVLVFGFHWIPVKGKQAGVKEAPICLIAPHSNIMDSWMLTLYAWGSVMSRRENESMPIIGSCLKSCEPIWVDRDMKKGLGTVQEMINRIQAPDNWTRIVLFPEGTVHNTDSVIGFKTGAFRPGVPVQPLIWKCNRDPGLGIWSHYGPSIPMTFFLTMCQLHNTCEVEYLPVYVPNEEEKKDAQLYAANVQKLVAKALDKPVSHYGLEDLRLVQKSVDDGWPRDCALVEYNLINRLFGLRLPDLMVMLKRFMDINKSKSGLMSEEEFITHLQWPIEEHARLLFNEYNTCSDKAEIRFREYVVGTADLVLKVPDGDAIAFNTFDALSSGRRVLSARCMLDYLHQMGYKSVPLVHVEAFLNRVSQTQDLTPEGFAAFVEASPDVAVLLHWMVNGTDGF